MREAARLRMPSSKIELDCVWILVESLSAQRQAAHRSPTAAAIPVRPQTWKPALHQKDLKFTGIKRPGCLAPGDGETWWKHTSARLAAALPGLERRCLRQPREAGSSRGLGWREAAACQHQHGTSLQAALAETKRGEGKSTDVQPPGSNLNSRAVLC